MTLTIIFLRTILFDNRFGHEWNHCTEVRMEHCRPQHLVIIGNGTVAVDLVQTRLTVNRLGGEIAGAIESKQIGPMQEHHGFKHFAALELPKNACEGSCAPTLLIIPSAQKPGKMPHLTTRWRGQCHGLTSVLLPTRSVGHHLALRPMASH